MCMRAHTYAHSHTVRKGPAASPPTVLTVFFLTKLKISLRGLNPALCRDQDVAQSNPLRQDSNPGCNPLRRCTGCILIQRSDFGDRRSGFQERPRGSSPALGRDKEERKRRGDVCVFPFPFFPPLTSTGNNLKRADVFLSASY